MRDHARHRGGRRHAAAQSAAARPRAAGRAGWRSRSAMAVTAAAAAVGGVAAPAVAAAAPEEPTSSEETPAAQAAHDEALVPGTPCTVSTRACVDLETDRAWLIDDGEVERGPMRVTTGARGYETPVGHSFRVYRHEADHVSGESRTEDGNPSPMPWSTFFADGGVAFHGGSLQRDSAGCVHMRTADAKAVFEAVDDGDKVQIVNGSEERAARTRES